MFANLNNDSQAGNFAYREKYEPAVRKIAVLGPPTGVLEPDRPSEEPQVAETQGPICGSLPGLPGLCNSFDSRSFWATAVLETVEPEPMRS
jgi:hypothetical protein